MSVLAWLFARSQFHRQYHHIPLNSSVQKKATG